MYKDSNFFFLDCWLLPFPSTLSLILSLSRSLYLSLPHSLAHSLAPPSPHAHADANSLFLSFFLLLIRPSIFIIHLQTNTLSYPPPPLFLSMHLFLSFTRSHDRGQEVEVRELRSLDYCCASSLRKFVSMTK